MTLLLDTHAFLWFVWDDPQLSTPARSAISAPQNRKLVSIASCWEIAIKTSIGKLQLGEPAATFIPRQLAQNHFDLLPVSLEHATGVERLPLHHRDPFDRILIALALAERVTIVSADAALDAYATTRLW
jgi:PIN domain nuclease of toxin-antitoxin system